MTPVTLGTPRRFAAKWLVAAMTCAASVGTTACGGGPTPTQPTQDTQDTQDGCRVIAANPVPGSVLQAGVSIDISVTGQCSLSRTATATAWFGGVMLPSQNPTGTATREISKGTTTVSLTIPFIPPASETYVGFFMAVDYNVAGMPPGQKADNGVEYTIR